MRVDVVLAFLLATTTAAAGQQTFGGYECTDDCSGHQAGYVWAEMNDVTSALECDSYSQSFTEGCLTYLADPERGAEADDDGTSIDGES